MGEQVGSRDEARRQWATPLVLPLGETPAGRGNCLSGSSDAAGLCNVGNNNFGPGGCGVGNTASLGCTVGGGGF